LRDAATMVVAGARGLDGHIAPPVETLALILDDGIKAGILAGDDKLGCSVPEFILFLAVFDFGLPCAVIK